MRKLTATWARLSDVRGSTALATIVLVGAAVFFGSSLNRHYPIEHWLFWRYATYWVCVAAWALGCLGVGLVVLDRFVRVRLPILERTLFAFTIGQLAFEWAMFVFGAAQAYRTFTFFLVPLGFIALSSAALKSYAAHVRQVAARVRPPRNALRLLAIGFGCLGLLMVYFLVLTPENVQFDSRWKHMALAEDYVAHRGIRRATEGWLFAARPHLTSYLYAWAFLLPNAKLFDQMLLCAHLEYFTFALTTVIGIPALVRRIVPRADPSAVWAARFLFPGLFVYDSSVSGGTDHFGALYAVPIGLALLRAVRGFELRWVAVLAALLAGASLVKETIAIMLVPFPLAVVAVCWVRGWLRWRSGRSASDSRRLKLAPLVGVTTALLVSIPLWLKNLVLYGDPLYPNLARFFPARPWSEQAAYRFKWSYAEKQMWAPERNLDGLADTLETLVNYSLEPNNWVRFHRDVPVFGSLFTLLLLVLPLLKGTRRIWFFVLWVHVAIFIWYSVHHQDRYLQGIVPMMAACVAAILVLLWRSFGAPARAAAALLVGLQIVWGGDAYFFQTHAMARSVIKKVVDLLSSGFDRNYEDRFTVQRQFQAIREHTRRSSRVLFHELHPHLGTGRESVLDSYQWQYAIDYGNARTPEGVRQLLSSHGVTHVHFTPRRSNAMASLASDIVFAEFVTRHAKSPVSLPGGARLVTVPSTPLTAPFEDGVVVLTCGKKPESGFYRTAALDVPPYGPKADAYGPAESVEGDPEDALEYLPSATWLVIDTACYKGGYPPETRGFELAVQRKRDTRELWRRRDASARSQRAPEAPEHDTAETAPSDAPE